MDCSRSSIRSGLSLALAALLVLGALTPWGYAANICDPVVGTQCQGVTPDGVSKTSLYRRGPGYAVSSVTGTIGAALGANSAVFCMRLDPGTAIKAYIANVRIQWATVVAFTTAVTAGRRLALYRGAGAACSGGTGLAAAAKARITDAASEFDSASGGDMRIATTGALTVTGITFEAQEAETLHLTGQGAAGATRDFLFTMDDARSGSIRLEPGEVIAIRNPVAMDAGGTWQIGVTINWWQE